MWLWCLNKILRSNLRSTKRLFAQNVPNSEIVDDGESINLIGQSMGNSLLLVLKISGCKNISHTQSFDHVCWISVFDLRRPQLLMGLHEAIL